MICELQMRIRGVSKLPGLNKRPEQQIPTALVESTNKQSLNLKPYELEDCGAGGTRLAGWLGCLMGHRPLARIEPHGRENFEGLHHVSGAAGRYAHAPHNS